MMNAANHHSYDRRDGSRIIDPEQELSSLRVAQDDVLQSRSLEASLPKGFELQPLTLDSAVAPLLKSPITPFQKSERKKAHTSAMYYSECFLKGVTPTDADNAASDIQGRYNKWWVESGFHDDNAQGSGETEEDKDERREASRFDIYSADDSTVVSTHTKRPHHAHHISDTSQASKASVARKRMRRRGGVREIIQDNTVDPHEQAVRSVSSVTVDEDYFRSSLHSTSRDEFPIRSIPNLSNGVSRSEVEAIRDELVQELKANGGDTSSVSFQSKLSVLTSFYLSSDNDARTVASAYELDGTWLTLTKPTYPDTKGRNEIGQYMYALGRMSFDMFRPTGLVCSIQGTFNTIHALDPASEQLPVFIPRPLRREVWRSSMNDQPNSLRTYNIVVAFTIEPNQTRTGQAVRHPKPDEVVIRRPIRGIMTNYGYILPDPNVPNRLSVWFTGGSLEVNDEESDLEDWKRIFDDSTVPKRDMREFARLLAAKVLLGANTSDKLEPDGSMNYTLKRPIGGHGSAFCDVLYLDDSLRIMRGHHGSLFIFSKVITADGQEDD